MGTRTQDFSENQDQDHSDEETRLLCCTANTSITNDTNGETGSKTGQTDGETSTELDETGVERKVLLQVVGDQDGNDETVDTNNTSHNDGHNVCKTNESDTEGDLRELAIRTLDNQIRSEDTHGSDTDTRLGGTIGSTQTGEDDGAGAAHCTKEGLRECQSGVAVIQACRIFQLKLATGVTSSGGVGRGD